MILMLMKQTIVIYQELKLNKKGFVMKLLIILMIFSFNVFAEEIVIDKDLLSIENEIQKERDKNCTPLKKTFSKWNKCWKKTSYLLYKKNEGLRLGTLAHAEKNYFKLTTDQLKEKSLELEALYKKVRGSDQFMMYEQEKGEVSKSMVGSANNYIHQELNRREGIKQESKIDEYNRLLGVKN